jgi:iron complex outermembrane receptor protein
VPVTDGFRLGATVASFNRDGFGDNLTTGGEQYNKDIFGYRLSAEFEPTDNIMIRVAYDNTDDKSNAVAGWRPFPGAFSGTPSPAACLTPMPREHPAHDGRHQWQQPGRAEGWMASVDWDLNDAITLRSITAGREDFTESVIDFDSLATPDFDAPVIYDNEQFSQEFQLLYNADRMNLVLGYYYLDSEAANDFDVVLGLLAPGGLTAYTGGVVETEAWSVFADFTYDLTDRWSLSVGGRYTEDERSADVFRGTSTWASGSPAFGNDSPY